MKSLLITLLFLIPITGFPQQKKKNFSVQLSATAKPDVKVDGATGLVITYKYDIQPLVEKKLLDSLYKGAEFRIETSFSADGQNVNCVEEYKPRLANNIDEIQKLTYLKWANVKTNKKGEEKVFLPYALFDLTPGTHELTVKSTIICKDGFKDSVELSAQNVQLNFTKPPTKIFTITIEKLVVKNKDNNGTAWDFQNPFVLHSSNPDPWFRLTLGKAIAWERYNTNTFDVPKPDEGALAINATISEGDVLTLSLDDFDLTSFSDPIAKWVFTTAGKVSGQVYFVNEKKPNLKEYSMNYKIEHQLSR